MKMNQQLDWADCSLRIKLSILGQGLSFQHLILLRLRWNVKGSRAAGFANISNRQVGSYLCLSLLSALTMFPFCLLILWAPLPKLLLHLARDTRRPLHRQHTLLLFLNFDARFFFFKLSTQSSCFLPNWLWFLHLIVQSFQMKLFWIFASTASNYWKFQC